MKFKKHISVFLAFFILVSNVGMAFNVHYCGKKIASVSLNTTFATANPERNCCGIIEKKASCCKNKVVHFQKKSADSILKSFSFQTADSYLIQDWKPIVFTSVSNFKNGQIATYYCDAHAPPLFKLYHQYLFYA